MQTKKSRIWTFIELFQEYPSYFGSTLTRANLVNQMYLHFSKELLVLTSPGITSIIAFRSNTLKIVKDNDEDDLGRCVDKVGTYIIKECKAFVHDKSSYNAHIDKHIANEDVSSTLQALLSAISEKFDQSLPALLIGNIITSIVNNFPTDLQIALAVLLRNSKEIVSHMYDYRITCSYDELLRFKKSVVVAAAKDLAEQGISDAKHGLVQVVSDNFDTDISSPNGKASTHSLEMIVMQPTCDNHPSSNPAIRRLQRYEISQAIQETIGE